MGDQSQTKTDKTGGEQSLPVSPYKASLTCTCPACGKAPIFKNGLELREKCEACGFDMRHADPGDGAQVFVILIMGTLCAIFGIMLHGAFGISLPVVGGILFVFIIVGSLWMLRVTKALLVALQFHHDAREGSLENDDKKTD